MKTTRCVALLRGINVGRAKRVAMADLRALIEQLGYGDVRTLLNSGNVVFSSPAAMGPSAGERIEESLATKLGVTARVTMLTAAELAGIVADNPMLDMAIDPSRLLVTVLSDPRDRVKLEPLLEQDWAPDRLAIGRRAAYVNCVGGILESRLAKAVGSVLGNAATSRNWATILKLHALTKDKS
jgi:uncharacterized protein (DUF1697 family)